MYGQSGLQGSKFVLTLYCFAKSLMHIATSNSTFRPLLHHFVRLHQPHRDEAGEDERNDEGDFAVRLSLARFLLIGVTATAIRAEADGADADAITFVTDAPVVFTCLPEKGL
jgi:hypothetical protein